MILYRLMLAFPNCRFSVGDYDTRDTWDVALLHGALPPGMSDWMAERNLHAVRRTGHDGYVIRWLRFGPDPERAVFAALTDMAEQFVSDSETPKNASEMTAKRYQINQFITMRTEAGL